MTMAITRQSRLPGLCARVAAAALVLALAGCGDEGADGETERMGEALQQDAEQALDAARDAAGDMTERAGEMAEEAGRAMGDAAGRAMDEAEDVMDEAGDAVDER